MKSLRRFCLSAITLATLLIPVLAQQEAASLILTNGEKKLSLPLFPATEAYRIHGAPDLDSPWSILNSGAISGFTWTDAITAPQAFFRVEAVSMSPSDTLAALVLNRLAYGPTPDELERVKAMGADAYIAEQLAPENIVESLDIDQVNTSRDWRRVVVTGVPTNRDFYIYQTSPGDVYIDDVRLVPGTNADGAGNVITDGGFETPLTGWTISTNMSEAFVDTAEAHSGLSSLHLITTTGGTTRGSSIWKTLSTVTLNSTTYTLSFWWKPGTNINPNLVLRFSQDGIRGEGNLTMATRLELDSATTDDLRAWHVLHAVRSKKQLEEVLLQFLENHFVTQVSKTRDYFDDFYDDGDIDRRAYRTEYKEIQRWRAALEQPACTFSNLLKISAESPAQIIYLDTVDSRGNGSNIPNENYARELLELDTFGVDNGYDQTDVTLMSRAWTGWSVNIVDPAQEMNPLAARSTTLRPGGTNVNRIENLAGVWAFNYKSENHWDQGATILFPGKKVPARFGPPYAGRNYTLAVDVDANVNTNWQKVVMTGSASSGTLYMYLESPGDIYVDDVTIVAGSTPDVGVNLVSNGGFESGISSGWNVSPNHATSAVAVGGAHSGTRSLHMVSTTPGLSRDTSIYKTGIQMTTDATYTLSFWWRPGTNMASSLTLRLSGSGIVASAPPRLPGSGLQDGYRVIGHLSDQPFTQEFISVKLCRLFVHDHFTHGVYDYTDPNLSAEGKLVRACMDAWENNIPKGQIRKVLKVIFDSELFRSQAAVAHKVKTPFEFTVSAVRALRSVNANGSATAQTDGYGLKSPMDRMGAMKLFDRAEPDGYPEAAAPWISAGTLAERLRWVQSFLLNPTSDDRGDVGAATACDPVALLKKKLSNNQWSNAGAVADYFLSILLPGEGKANLDLYRTAAINFLNTANNGGSSPFLNLPNASTTDDRYDTRVRGMVAAIMTSQRFHEQ